MASPPKPWERAGSGGATLAASSVSSTVPTPATTPSTSTTSSSAPPPIPERPASLTSSVNQNAAAYSRPGTMNSMGYGGAYSSPYSSPYSRFGGGYGGGYGGGMYGSSMYGGGMYGGGMYGGMGGMGGMGMGNPNDPNSLTNRFSTSTATTFQMLEGIVMAFGGFSQMLESTYMATQSSFFAMVSVAEQFGNLRETLGSVLGIFTLMRWLRTLIAKITGRPPPADATALTPAAFARFEGRTNPDGTSSPPRASRKPLIFFLLAAFGIPYLMSKMIKSLAASHEEEQQRLQQQALQSQQPMDPSKLEFCRLLYDFVPQPNTGVELEVRKGDLIAVLNKNDPAGQPSDWWQCRSRDGRQGYVPSTYLEVLKRPNTDVKQIQAANDSRTNSLTSSVSEPQKKLPGPEGKKDFNTVDDMQRSHFYS